MANSKHVLIVAGDESADQHGSELIRALRLRLSNLRVSALGGNSLRSAADHFLFPLVEVGGFGFWEPIFKLPQLWKARQAIRTLLSMDPPDLVVPIDYYGFNIHVTRMAHARQIPVVYYISPQVWASRSHRIQALKQVVDKMLVLFPFEAELYRSAGVPVRYVGHPIIDRIPKPATPADPPRIGLLPGSRRSVVARHLPILVRTAAQLRKARPQIQFFLFRPASIEPEFYREALKDSGIELVHDPNYEQRKVLYLSIGVSGTSALENTLLGIPMVVMYRLSAVTYWIARRLVRIPYIAIPNILANSTIIPEFLQQDANPQKLAAAALQLLEHPDAWNRMREALLALRHQLGESGTSQRAAEEIVATLEGTNPTDMQEQLLAEAFG
jgi:lipid-A-disaccharide synthase